MWLALFLRFRKLRKEIMFGSVIYPSILILLFLLTWLLSQFFDLTWRYTPDYWNPNTLFNLIRITGGLSIEDFLFMFFFGGIVSIAYEVLFKRKSVRAKKKHHILSLVGFVGSYLFIAFLFSFNPIYNLIISSFVGFLIMLLQRPDLFKHALWSACIFTAFYFLGFFLFNLVFPYALSTYWNLNALSGVLLFNVPLEEFLYAFSFGLMWGPLYEYVKGKKIK